MFVQRVRDLQPTNKCECRDVLTAVGELGELAFGEIDVRFEVVVLPHLDGEEVMVVLLGFPARGVLRKKLRLPPRSCEESGATKSRTNLTPHFSDWRER